MEKQYNIGIYMRLSRMDGDDDESDSISNQRMIIKNYISKNFSYINCYEYIDDGYSGSNFNRPAFMTMINDIDSKKVNMIITKSLSRFGRNYIDSGRYIEKIFPDNDVRYIAIIDNIDTGIEYSSNDFLPIKAILNELYCRETSKNIKTSKKRNRINGEYNSTTPLYGYKKDENKKGNILINEETAPIVRRIFEMASQGIYRREIADYLNKRKIKTPSQYANFKKPSLLWKCSTVSRILENENYTGKCISGKTVKISYKSKKRLYIPRNERLCVKNTHEAIISEELYRKCHDNNKYGKQRNKRDIIFRLKPFMYCEECKRKLSYALMRYDKYSFKCPRNVDSEELCSNNGRYSYHKTERIIFDIINEIINIEDECNKINKKKMLSRIIADKKYSTQNKINTKEKELRKITNDIKFIYEKRLSFEISDKEYLKKYEEFKERKKIKEKELKLLNDEMNCGIDMRQNRKILTKIIETVKSKGIENFSEDELSLIIDKIFFYKNKINIIFKFKIDQNNQKIVTYKK